MKIFLSLAVLLSAVACSTHSYQPIAPEVTAAPDELYNRLPSSECDSAKYKECKEARKNDTADRYMLGHDGTLYRRINKATCAVTGNVQSFKISQHPNDVAVIYYKKNGDLYLVNKDKEVRGRGQCPSAEGNTKRLMKDVKKYTVTSNTDTTIVNAALDNSGVFSAWDNVKVVYTDSTIEDFQMNECFGVKGKSFNSYVLFTLDRFDHISKVKVTKEKYLKDDSKLTTEKYSKISTFKDKQNVCQ